MKKFYCNSKKGICCKILCNSCKLFDKTGGYYIDDETPQPQTNFEKITSSVDALVEWVIKNFHNYPEAMPCLKDDCKSTIKTHCIECFKKWLEQECQE